MPCCGLMVNLDDLEDPSPVCEIYKDVAFFDVALHHIASLLQLEYKTYGCRGLLFGWEDDSGGNHGRDNGGGGDDGGRNTVH